MAPAETVHPANEASPSSAAAPNARPDPGDIDEGRDAYRPGGFHPVYIGNVYADRYRVLNKIGYGVYSTVWLVEDLTKTDDDKFRFRALKVLSAESYSEDQPIFEKEILTHLRDGDRKQLGYAYVCHLVDDFKHQGPNGTHVCLVFELMGETLGSFGAWFKESMIPYSVIRRFTIQLLLALDFAHDHNVIHTDIKPDNIFVKFRDPSLIESGYLTNVPIPCQDKTESGYTPVPSRPLRRFYFDEADSKNVAEFNIALGDWGVSSWTTQHLTERIQPIALRSPEVLIEAPWDAKTNWWNLGALLLELYRTVRMFDGRVAPDGHYEVKEHLAEIVDLFGPVSKQLLERGNRDLVQSIFDADGRVKGLPPMGRPPLASEAFMPGLNQEARDEFDSFLRALMRLDPAERVSTEDLLRHPWLGAMRPLGS